MESPTKTTPYPIHGDDRGVRLLIDKKYGEAWQEFQQQVEGDPEDIFALFYRGKAAYHLKHFDDTIADMHLAVSLHPNFASEHKRGLALFYEHLFCRMLETEPNQIKQAFAGVVGARPAIAAIYTRALSFYYLGLYDKALEDFTHVLRCDRTFAAAYLFRGTTFYVLKQYYKAIRDLQKCIELEPTATACYNLGLVYMAQNNLHKAVESLTQSLTFASSDPAAYNLRGSAFRELKEYPKAIADFSLAITLDPNYANAYNNRALCYRDLGEFEKALQDCTAAIGIQPPVTERYFLRSLVHNDMKRYNEAIEDLTSAIEIDPWEAKLYYTRGSIQRHLGFYGKALNDFTKTIALDPNHGRAHHHRGALLARDDALKVQATTDLKTSLKLSPKITEAKYLLKTSLW